MATLCINTAFPRLYKNKQEMVLGTFLGRAGHSYDEDGCRQVLEAAKL